MRQFNHEVCTADDRTDRSWNVHRLLHKPSHSGTEPEPASLSLRSVWKTAAALLNGSEQSCAKISFGKSWVSCSLNVSTCESTGWIHPWKKTKTKHTALPILIIRLDFLGPSTAGQTLTSTFHRPCDSVFTGKTRSHSFLPGGTATESPLKYNLEMLHKRWEFHMLVEQYGKSYGRTAS